MIRRTHIYLVFGCLVSAMTVGLLVLLSTAIASGAAKPGLLFVVGTGAMITTGIAATLFVTAWKVRGAPD